VTIDGDEDVVKHDALLRRVVEALTIIFV